MRICLLAPSLQAGGAERQLVFLANGLVTRGHDVHVVLFNMEGPFIGDLHPSVGIYDLGKKGRGNFSFVWKFAQFLRRKQIDFLYSFLGVPNLVAALLKPCLSQIKLIWSVRASNVKLDEYSFFTGVCWGLEKLLTFIPDMIIANSVAGKAYVQTQGFPAGKIEVVPNGIDTEKFFPDKSIGAKLRLEWGGEDSLLVGLVARIDPMKGHRHLLRAAEELLQEYDYVRFVCIGTGDERLLGDLKCLAKRAGVADKVIWAGEQNQMQAVYNALDVCCLPSEYGEGFPNVLGEAMSCGIPCVASDVGDSALVVGGTGEIAPAGNPAALASALRRIILRISRGEDFGTVERIKRRFSVETMVCETERLLKTV